jgi:hypothetical protein
MKLQIFVLLALVAAVAGSPFKALAAAAGSQYGSIVLQNQFGEKSINSILPGGSSGLDCNFIVDSTNGNGLGIRSLKGTPCAAVYMHTSSTPAAGNPNPAAGYIVVQMSKNYYGYTSGFSGFVSPLSGSNVSISSGLTQYAPYVIVTVGTSTAANWQAVGLPAGLTPTVGQSFIASTASAGTGTGVVQAPATGGSAVEYIDVIGDPNQEVGATAGATFLLRTLVGMVPTALPTPSATPIALQASAPANNSVVALHFSMLPLSSQLK